MSATRRIFDEDSYITEFEAEVISCTETENGFDIVLDKTAFFTEGGGQFPDKGTLNDIEVLDVQEDKNGIIHHFSKIGIQAFVKYNDGSVRISYITPTNAEALKSAKPGVHTLEWSDDWGDYSYDIVIK